MKILKLSDDIHNALKEHLKDTNVFMQSYVEYLINKSIQNGMIYAMKDKIELFKYFLNTQELDSKKGKRTVLKPTVLKIKNPKTFEIEADYPIQMDDYLKTLTSYNNVDESTLSSLYFNVPGYHNVKNPKVKPDNLQGVLQYVGKSRITGFPYFRLLENIQEKIEDVINKEPDGEFQLSIKCKINNKTFSDEEHFPSMMSRHLDDLNFETEMGLKFETEKIDLLNRKEFSLDEFNSELLEYLKENSKYSEHKSKFIFEDKESSVSELNVVISLLSNLMATHSRFGPATHCIIPSWLTEKFKDSIFSFTSQKAADKLSEQSEKIKLLGSLAGILYFESDEIDQIYLYRSCENSLKFCYSFDKCNVDEINTLIINDSEEVIYKLDVLRKYDSTPINEKILNDFKVYDFIDIDGTYSPYNLDVLTYSFQIPKNDLFEKTGLDCKSSSEHTLVREIFQNVLQIVLNTENHKNEEFKIYGNEPFNELRESFVKALDKYSRTDSTPLVVNGLVAGFLRDFYDFTPIQNISAYGASALQLIGSLGKRKIYVDPFMRFDDTRMIFLNDVQLKHSKDGVLVSAYKNDNFIVMTTSYKILTDIVVLNIIDNEKKMF